MSKLDDVLEGTNDDQEELAAREAAEVGDDKPDEAAVAELKGKLEEVEANPVEPATTEAGGYETAEEILTAEANGEITEAEAVALLDQLEETEGDGGAAANVPDPEPEPDGDVAGPRDRVRIVKTGEVATVAHSVGNGGVALTGEEKPRRTLARHEYTLVD